MPLPFSSGPRRPSALTVHAPTPPPPAAAVDWRAVVDSLDGGVVVVDACGCIVDRNEAAAAWLELDVDADGTTQALLGGRWRFQTPQGQPLPDEAHPVARTLRGEGAQPAMPLDVVLPSGRQRRLSVRTRPLPAPAACLLLLSAEGDVFADHSLLQGLFELSPAGISLMDMRTGRPVAVNQALCRLLGYTRQEMLAMDLSVCTPPELQAERSRRFRQALDTGIHDVYESVLLHRSGQRVPVLRSGARVTSPDGGSYVWSVAQDITSRRAMEQELRAAATQDKLTGLPNRGAFKAALEAAAERARQDADFRFTVMFMDFDRFKLVNDSLGHAAGDQLLLAIAQRLSAALRTDTQPPWLVSRFGGDEFVLLAPGLHGPAQAQAFGLQLLASLEQPYEVDGKPIRSSASIGAAFSQGARTRSDDLLRDADIAMYEAKRSGRGRLVVFDDTMRSQVERAAQIDAALHQALALQQMTVVYQPIVDLDSGCMVSVEALLRWQHPALGAVSPAEFIPIAEESGQVMELGEWVLQQACRQWRRWQDQDPERAPASVSVNLSRAQLSTRDRLLARVREALAESALPEGALQLEITEREVSRHAGDTRELMQDLRGLGVRLAMDDFGTGASSLGCLREFPLHTIKIDKSFVTDLCRDPHLLAVAHATVDLIENLGMASVAEGIEQPEELATLQAMGCRYGQGFLLGEPMPGDELLRRMAPPGAGA